MFASAEESTLHPPQSSFSTAAPSIVQVVKLLHLTATASKSPALPSSRFFLHLLQDVTAGFFPQGIVGIILWPARIGLSSAMSYSSRVLRPPTECYYGTCVTVQKLFCLSLTRYRPVVYFHSTNSASDADENLLSCATMPVSRLFRHSFTVFLTPSRFPFLDGPCPELL